MIDLSVLFKPEAFEWELILLNPLARKRSSDRKHRQPHTQMKQQRLQKTHNNIPFCF
jgi:hypothetical protein